MWEVESGRELRTLTGHTDAVLGVAVSAGRADLRSPRLMTRR